MTQPLSRTQRAALSMLTAWMGEHFFRTFRRADPAEEDPAPFDALLSQRGRRVGVTVGLLWEEDPLPGADSLERLVSSEVGDDGGGYALWAPPRAPLPLDEPKRSEFRLLIANGLSGLAAGERREVRLPVRLRLAKIDDEGAYVSVTGGLATLWARISEGVRGAYHLDSRAIFRTSEESAELDIVLARIRDRAEMLNVEEVTEVAVHDYWLVSRLTDDDPAGLTVIGAPPTTDPADGTSVRRLLRHHVRRAVEQRAAGECDFAVLLLVGALAHIQDELATAALRGMSPAAYSPLDLIALAADGRIRQMLQPRSLPWEA